MDVKKTSRFLNELGKLNDTFMEMATLEYHNRIVDDKTNGVPIQ